MNFLKYITIAFIVILILACFLRAQDISVDSTIHILKEISAEEAILKALKLTGFDELKGFNRELSLTSIEKVTTIDTLTPFLADSISGKKAWKIELEDINVALIGSDSGIQREGNRNFTIYIDMKGRLLKIVSQVEGYNEPDWHKPSANVATQQLKNHKEKYLGFPEQLPSVSFINALHVIMGDPVLAEEIVAIYIVHLYQDKKPRPVWDIHLYGVKDILGRDELPFYITDHIRSLIDAMSGEFIFANNLPFPHSVE